jgi:ribonuclease P protein subunit POP4
MEKYNVNERNFMAHELIGLKVKVKESTAMERIGMAGKIVDETKNTFKIETAKGEKLVPKKECVFEFALPGNAGVSADGRKLCFRPEDRVKEYWRKAI